MKYSTVQPWAKYPTVSAFAGLRVATNAHVTEDRAALEKEVRETNTRCNRNYVVAEVKDGKFTGK